jgi:shikimate dehydrogenase
MTGKTRCAVLGSPIAHSLSPALHRAAYADLGLDWRYEAVEVDEAELAGFLDGLDDSWRGLSLTMPLKRAVLPMLDDLDPWAEAAGAANTVVIGVGRHGHNTDVPGAAAALREQGLGAPASAVVLGGGATAASVLLALGDLGCRRARMLVRDPGRAAPTREAVARHAPRMELSVGPLEAPVEPVDVLVSTIPASAQSPALVRAVAAVGVVFDVVYDPWPTPLAAAAAEHGRVLVSGLDLLIHQAALQVRLMTGRTASLGVLRAAGERALAERSRT